MMNSDDNFDDFELGDDMDDSWDESIDEQKGDSKTKSKINFIKPLLAVILLGSGAYLFLPFVMPSDSKNEIPIIKLDEAQNIYKGDIAESNTSLTDIMPSDTNLEVNKENVVTEITPLKAKEEANNTVLTPMPENISENEMPLAELIMMPEIEPLVKDIIIPENNINAEPELLIEDDLLLKTESEFGELTVQDADDINDIIPQMLNIENIKETEDVLRFDSNTIEKPLVSPVQNEINGDVDKMKEDFIKKPELNLSKEIKVLEKAAPIITKEAAPIITKKAEPIITKKKFILKKKKPIWVIRAAQSGSAIIYDKVSKEMKSIEVNDTVNGVGRIKSIKFVDGVWVVIGTSGKIEQ